jgi:hypothetical protein
MPIGRIAAASIGFEQRRVVATEATHVRESLGFGADVGATLGFPFARLSARGGMLRHGGTTDEAYGSAGAIAWWRAWRASAEVRRELAYPHLMTARVLAVPGETEAGETVDASVMATRQIYGVAGAIGTVDIGIVADLMELSDGNSRPAITTTVRYPLSDALSALYVASDVRFRQPSPFYWDPQHYAAHSLGLETSHRRDRGFSHMARFLAGLSRSAERATGADLESATSYSFHGTVEGEMVYRVSRWEAGLASWYGRARDEGYRRWGGSARIRVGY